MAFMDFFRKKVKPSTVVPLTLEEKKRMVEAYHQENRDALVKLGLGKMVKQLEAERASDIKKAASAQVKSVMSKSKKP